MEKEFSRTLRIKQEIQKEIASILQRKIQDPRIKMITTISGVEISRDLTCAKVFVTFLNKQEKETIKNQMQILQKASGFIRFLLGKALHLRIVPKLIFFHDTTLIEGMRISHLLASIVEENTYVRLHKREVGKVK